MGNSLFHSSVFAACLAASFPQGFADDTECCPPSYDECCCDSGCEVLLEARVSYFHPTDSRYRRIYGGAPFYNVELSVESYCNFYPWLSVGYLYDCGHSIGKRNRTKIDLVPMSLGLKYLFCCDCFRPYLGAGLGVTYLKTEDHSKFVIKNRSNWGAGGVFKLGLIYDWTSCFFIDLFIDYTYMKIDFGSGHHKKRIYGHDADVSGFFFGAGLGYSF